MRKQPRQQRSRDMVERIITAGREVLVRDGYADFSTNRVATAAGVSPGSLYQYFPDKASIIDVVVRRYQDEVSEQAAAALSDRIGLVDQLTLIRQTADALLTALESDPALLRVVAEELPLSHTLERRTALHRRVRDLLTVYLAGRPELGSRHRPPTAAWFVVVSAEAIATRWVLEQPPIERDELIDELVGLFAAYLLS